MKRLINSWLPYERLGDELLHKKLGNFLIHKYGGKLNLIKDFK